MAMYGWWGGSYHCQEKCVHHNACYGTDNFNELSYGKVSRFGPLKCPVS